MAQLLKELGGLLRSYRKDAKLTLRELAQRLKLSPEAAKSYLSRLERGKIKNPHLNTILNYLQACNVRWPEFFKNLELKSQYLESALVLRKLNHTIDAQHKPKLYRASQKYQASLNLTQAAKRNHLASAKRQLSPELQTQMHHRYMEYLANITNIESSVHKLLDRFTAPLVLYQRYKSFARAVYKVLTKKRTRKNLTIDNSLTTLQKKYTSEGLNSKILFEIIELVRKYLPAPDA